MSKPYMAILIGIMAISFGSIFAKMAQAPSLITASYR
ncbi:MAG TPA: EamA family transporter, partial [Clostridia bacterium]|nr:EamA family transporter [Clostridia bacterium]